MSEIVSEATDALKEFTKKEFTFRNPNVIEKITLSFVDPLIYKEAYVDPYLSIYVSKESFKEIKMNHFFKPKIFKASIYRDRIEITKISNTLSNTNSPDSLFISSINKTKYPNELVYEVYYLVDENIIEEVYYVTFKNIIISIDEFKKKVLSIGPQLWSPKFNNIDDFYDEFSSFPIDSHWYMYPIDQNSETTLYELSSRFTTCLTNTNTRMAFIYYLFAHTPMFRNLNIINELENTTPNSDYVNYVLKKMEKDSTCKTFPPQIYAKLIGTSSLNVVEAILTLKTILNDKLILYLENDPVSLEKIGKIFNIILGPDNFFENALINKNITFIEFFTNPQPNFHTKLNTEPVSYEKWSDIVLYCVMSQFMLDPTDKTPKPVETIQYLFNMMFDKMFIPLDRLVLQSSFFNLRKNYLKLLMDIKIFSTTTTTTTSTETTTTTTTTTSTETTTTTTTIEPTYNQYHKHVLCLLMIYKTVELNPCFKRNLLRIDFKKVHKTSEFFSNKFTRNKIFIKIEYHRVGNGPIYKLLNIIDLHYIKSSDTAEIRNEKDLNLLYPERPIMSLLLINSDSHYVPKVIHHVKPFDKIIESIQIPKYITEKLKGASSIVWYYSDPGVDITDDVDLITNDYRRNTIYKTDIINWKNGTESLVINDDIINVKFPRAIEKKSNLLFDPSKIKVRGVGNYYAMAYYTEEQKSYLTLVKTYVGGLPLNNTPPQLVFKLEIKLESPEMDSELSYDAVLDFSANELMDKHRFPLYFPRENMEKVVNMAGFEFLKILDQHLLKRMSIDSIVKYRSDYPITISDNIVNFNQNVIFNFMQQDVVDYYSNELKAKIDNALLLISTSKKLGTSEEEKEEKKKLSLELTNLTQEIKSLKEKHEPLDPRIRIQPMHQGDYYILINVNIDQSEQTVSENYYKIKDPVMEFIMKETPLKKCYIDEIPPIKRLELFKNILKTNDDYSTIDFTLLELPPKLSEFIVIKVRVNVKCFDIKSGIEFNVETFRPGTVKRITYAEPEGVRMVKAAERNDLFKNSQYDIGSEEMRIVKIILNQLKHDTSAYITLSTNMLIFYILKNSLENFEREYKKDYKYNYSQNSTKIEPKITNGSFESDLKFYGNSRFQEISKQLSFELLENFKSISCLFSNNNNSIRRLCAKRTREELRLFLTQTSNIVKNNEYIPLHMPPEYIVYNSYPSWFFKETNNSKLLTHFENLFGFKFHIGYIPHELLFVQYDINFFNRTRSVLLFIWSSVVFLNYHSLLDLNEDPVLMKLDLSVNENENKVVVKITAEKKDWFNKFIKSKIAKVEYYDFNLDKSGNLILSLVNPEEFMDGDRISFDKMYFFSSSWDTISKDFNLLTKIKTGNLDHLTNINTFKRIIATEHRLRIKNTVDIDFDNFIPSLLFPTIHPEIKRIVIDSFRTSKLQKKILDIKGLDFALGIIAETMKGGEKFGDTYIFLIYLLVKNSLEAEKLFNMPLKIKDTKY